MRLSVFLAGCPLRCQYCENPDTWLPSGGRLTPLGEVAERLWRYRDMLAATGGGLTVTGGEPLAQPAFTAALLHRARALGLHTAVDTSGFLGALASDQLLLDTDLVLLDIKSSDPDLYRRVTGQDLAPTLRFAHRLAELGRPAWVRFVLVPGLTDGEANVEGVADIVAGLPNVERVDVLGYHRLGVPKYAALGLPYRLAKTPQPTPAELDRAREIFRARGLRTT
ncbi:pyruvate formate-lyase-activating protein [Spongisporangium articulatum]|uniref:Pyruvate formate-lyase-activating enzyme n=1 Tax=Spongisporangium articulatum TaxID=3362603 RepID=A0ABW8AN76_9ACTN